MITRIRTRSDLLWYIQEHAPSRACSRAVVEGHTSLLGGFTTIPPFDRVGWIVRIESEHGKHWLVAVLIHPTTHEYSVKFVDTVPWEHWMESHKLAWYRGDIPLQAERARRRALENKNET